MPKRVERREPTFLEVTAAMVARAREPMTPEQTAAALHAMTACLLELAEHTETLALENARLRQLLGLPE